MKETVHDAICYKEQNKYPSSDTQIYEHSLSYLSRTSEWTLATSMHLSSHTTQQPASTWPKALPGSHQGKLVILQPLGQTPGPHTPPFPGQSHLAQPSYSQRKARGAPNDSSRAFISTVAYDLKGMRQWKEGLSRILKQIQKRDKGNTS